MTTTKKLFVLIAMFVAYFMISNSIKQNSKANIENTQQEVQSYASTSSIAYTGNRCDECGKECIEDKELRSSGDAMSNYQPYYLCGDMSCTNNRYEKDIKMERIEAQEDVYRYHQRQQDPAGEASNDKLRDWMQSLEE